MRYDCAQYSSLSVRHSLRYRHSFCSAPPSRRCYTDLVVPSVARFRGADAACFAAAVTRVAAVTLAAA
eukprot:2312636-Pleurochrysis_carterae.AAC.1